MRKIITIFILIFLFSTNAFAITLYDALNETYKNNTQLNAERENIKASEEDVNISEADYKPSLTLSGCENSGRTLEVLLLLQGLESPTGPLGTHPPVG